MLKYQCPIIHPSPEGDRCGAAGLRRYVQAAVTYVDSPSHHLTTWGGFRSLSGGLSLRFPSAEWFSFEEAGSVMN